MFPDAKVMAGLCSGSMEYFPTADRLTDMISNYIKATALGYDCEVAINTEGYSDSDVDFAAKGLREKGYTVVVYEEDYIVVRW